MPASWLPARPLPPACRPAPAGPSGEFFLGVFSVICGMHWIVFRPFHTFVLYRLMDELTAPLPGPSEWTWGPVLVLFALLSLLGHLGVLPRVRAWGAALLSGYWCFTSGLIFSAAPQATFSWLLLWVAAAELWLFFALRREGRSA